MKITRLLTIILGIFMIIQGHGVSGIVATYDGGKVTLVDIHDYMMEFKDYRQSLLLKYPDKAKRDPVVARKIVYDRLLVKEAVSYGMDTHLLVQAKLRDIENNILAKVYLQKEYVDPVHVSDKEVHDRYYQRITTHFTTPEKWTFRYIFLDKRKYDSDSSNLIYSIRP